MKRFRWGAPAAALALLAVAAPRAWTQQQAVQVGSIDQIREFLGGRDARPVRQPTPKAQVRSAGGTVWVDAAPERWLLHDERLRVARYVDVRLRVRRRGEQGTLVFLPELWEKGGTAVFTAGAQGGPRSPQGVYRVRTATAGAGDLTVEIEGGSLVVNWDHGRLAVVAAGTRTLISGTRLAVMVDSTGGAGAVFVDEGVVSFPDYPAVRLLPGQWAVLRRGLPPEVLSLAAADQRLARRTVRYHADGIWGGGPSWGRIATGVAVAVGVAVVASQAGDGPARPGERVVMRRGTVLVSLPDSAYFAADSVSVRVIPQRGASQSLDGRVGEGDYAASFDLSVPQGQVRFVARVFTRGRALASFENTHAITRDGFQIVLEP